MPTGDSASWQEPAATVAVQVAALSASVTVTLPAGVPVPGRLTVTE